MSAQEEAGNCPGPEEREKEWPFPRLVAFPLNYFFFYCFSLPFAGFAISAGIAFSRRGMEEPFSWYLRTPNQTAACKLIDYSVLDVPSFCSALQLYALAGFFWRFAVCLTAMPRICIGVCYWNFYMKNTVNSGLPNSILYQVACTVTALAHTLEVLSLCVMAIVPVGQSYPIHATAFAVFGIFSLLHVILNTLLYFLSGNRHLQEDGKKSFAIKLTFGFFYLVSFGLFAQGQAGIWPTLYCKYFNMLAHSAVAEYWAILSLFVFHATAYWDIFKGTEFVIEPNPTEAPKTEDSSAPDSPPTSDSNASTTKDEDSVATSNGEDPPPFLQPSTTTVTII